MLQDPATLLTKNKHFVHLDKRVKEPHIQAGHTMEEINLFPAENRTLYPVTS